MHIQNKDEIINIDSSSKRGKDSLENFSNLISKANDDIKYISKKINDLISIKSSVVDANNNDEKEITGEINNITNDFIEAKHRMDKIIKNLESDLNKDKYEKEDESDLRLKKNLFDAMIKKYQNVIQKFQSEENDMKQIKETKLIRNAEIGLGRDLTENEKINIIEDPKMIQQIYADKLKGKAHVKLQNAVRDLEERHRDIKKLEKSIIDLTTMITELNKLVIYQGEMIDNIVENVSKSKDYIFKAERELNKAKEKMK